MSDILKMAEEMGRALRDVGAMSQDDHARLQELCHDRDATPERSQNADT
jgi:hypothetical protein